jgi:uncharacterized protein YjbJ (UPF0337 family)
MSDERVQGAVRMVGGKVEEGLGKTAEHAAATAAGLMRQAAGTAEETLGKTKDVAIQGTQAAKDAAIGTRDFLRKFMEDNPHTTTVLALGVGFLIGYAAHQQPAPRNWWT